MCGIFCLINYQFNDLNVVYSAMDKLIPRGPDSQSMLSFKSFKNYSITMGFTRLAIMDQSICGMQPFHNMYGSTLICNGEIYNFKKLIDEYLIEVNSDSDCEVILPLYSKFNFKQLLNKLDGEFAIILYDGEENRIFVARDRYGVRPLYYGYNNTTKSFGFASELKALHSCMEFVEQVKPGEYIELDLQHPYDSTNLTFKIYYDYSILSNKQYRTNVPVIQNDIRCLLTKAVNKRLNADREIGFLLSGGLDSSLIVAIATKILGPDKITCFSIGIEGSPDVEAAKSVVKYLGITKHHIIPFDIESGIETLSEVIRVIETYDITTIRASTPQYLMSEYIKVNTDIRVLLSGEGSDEIHGSYRYFRDASSPEEFSKECVRLLKELCYFDNLRTDRTTAANGLEVRVPFLDFDYVDYIFKIDPTLLMYSSDYMEKKIIRDSFVGYLPDEILYRSKEAFSDAVSNNESNWAEEIKTYASNLISDEELKNSKFVVNRPMTKDALLFRRIFDEHYPDRCNVLPYYWLPRFQKEIVLDPSARVLKCY